MKKEWGKQFLYLSALSCALLKAKESRRTFFGRRKGNTLGTFCWTFWRTFPGACSGMFFTVTGKLFCPLTGTSCLEISEEDGTGTVLTLIPVRATNSVGCKLGIFAVINFFKNSDRMFLMLWRTLLSGLQPREAQFFF